MNYLEAKETFQRARNKDKGYSLENNTRLVKTNKGYGIKLHNTIVVDILPNGNYVLNTGGWFTRTTKDRINSYAPVSLYTHKRIWYLGTSNYNPKSDTAFCDGIIINSNGKVIKNPNAKQVNRIKNILKRINTYVNKYDSALKANKIPAPSGGDCWGCCMVDAQGNTVMGGDHLEQHLKEGYLVPSLLVNAIRSKGYNPIFVNPWNGWNKTTIYKRALRDFLVKNLAK